MSIILLFLQDVSVVSLYVIYFVLKNVITSKKRGSIVYIVYFIHYGRTT